MKRGARENIVLLAAGPASSESRLLIDVSWSRPVVYRVRLSNILQTDPETNNGNADPATTFLATFTLDEGLGPDSAEQRDVTLGLIGLIAGGQNVQFVEGVASQLRVLVVASRTGAAPVNNWLLRCAAVVATYADAAVAGRHIEELGQ